MSHKANPYWQCACAGSQSFSRGCAILRLERELAKVATAGPQARPGWDTRKASSCAVFFSGSMLRQLGHCGGPGYTSKKLSSVPSDPTAADSLRAELRAEVL